MYTISQSRWPAALLLLVLPFFCLAQRSDSGLDSLHQLLAGTPPDTNRVRLFQQLAWADGPDSADYYFTKARDLAQSLRAPRLVTEVLSDHGNFYIRRREYDRAIGYLRDAQGLAQAHGYQDKLPWYSLDMGIALFRLGRADSAFQYLSAAETGFIKQDDRYNLWRVYANKGRVYQSLVQDERAGEYFDQAYEIVKTGAQRADKGFVLYLAAENAYFNNRWERLAYYRNEWREYQRTKKQTRSWLEPDPAHTSLVHIFAGEDSLVLERLQLALAYYQQQQRRLDEANTHADLAIYYQEADRPADALLALQRADSIFQLINNRERRAEVLAAAYRLSKEMGRESVALRYLEDHVRLSDSLGLAEQLQTIQALETRLETAEKDRQLALQSVEISRKTRERNGLLGGILGLLALALAVFYHLRQRLLANRRLASRENELKEQRIRQLEQESRLTAYKATLAGQEAERQRIAQDLHDGLGGLLTRVKNQFERLDRQSDDSVYERTTTLIDEACGEVRRISHNMMPLSLSIAGLGPALEDLADDLRRGGLACTLEIINQPSARMAPERELMLFRIIQELANNIQKHAQARNVLIQLLYDDDHLQLLVEDDGLGLDRIAAGGNGTLGLTGIESRVRLLNGRIDWDGIPQEGTSVTIRLPMSATHSDYQTSLTLTA